MGLFRVILALSVVLFHVNGGNGYCITGGKASVQCFFIISGFYMSLILNDKYTDKSSNKTSLLLFYTNRLFRLMPLYYFFLLVSLFSLCLCLFLDISHYNSISNYCNINYFNRLDITTKVFLIISQVLVIGMDLSNFLGINLNNGSLFISSTALHNTPSWAFLFIPQAWTLSLEFYFYLLAPFFVKRTNIPTTIIVIILCFIMRFFIYLYGYNYNPWTYRFFPTELALFLLGTLSYQLYLFLKSKNLFHNLISFSISGIIFILAFCYPFLPQQNSVPCFFNDAQLIFYSTVILGLPFLFHISKQNSIDRFIGELSYPIYLCHLIIIPFFGVPLVYSETAADILYILSFTIIFSIFSVIFIQKYVDNYRQRRYQIMCSSSGKI